MEDDGDQTGKKSSRIGILLRDLLAGTVNAVVSVPSGMATAAMAGVNPVYGLYATVFSPTVSGFFASTQLMQVATTGASALAAGQAVAGFDAQQRGPALFLLVLVSGLFLVAFGLLGAGKLIRFVSYPVMTAFLSGVAVALVMDQSAQLAGYSSSANTSLGSFVDLLVNLDEASWNAVLIGVAALALMVGLGFTRLANAAALIALIIPTIVAVWWNPPGVEIVGDTSDIPSGFPPFDLPDLTLLTPELAGSALPSPSSLQCKVPESARVFQIRMVRNPTCPRTCLLKGSATLWRASFAACPRAGQSARVH